MAKFLTTSGVSYYIENIISKAKQELILISPYLKISKTLFERLTQANKRGVKITLVFGKAELDFKQFGDLKTIDNLEVYYFDNLHAKCYLNEDEIVITSMNLHHYSEKNNREMGVYASKKEDQVLYDEALTEVKEIVENSVLKKSRNEKQNQIHEKRQTKYPKTEIINNQELDRHSQFNKLSHLSERFPKNAVATGENLLSIKLSNDLYIRVQSSSAYRCAVFYTIKRIDQVWKSKHEITELVDSFNIKNKNRDIKLFFSGDTVSFNIENDIIPFNYDFNDKGLNNTIFYYVEQVSSYLTPLLIRIKEDVDKALRPKW